ncbi:MAG: TauD/TfdA family dioxygenase [Deltaproteobacteria bacterium]|jgi:taurine dioxygenase|nr:TauD/TfdA family dioxygenase [Deltaproteobacteria bacterium]
MSFRIERPAGALGAYVTGIDLAKPVDDETFAELHQAFLDHHVLCIRDQDITPAQQLAFSARWGTIFIHPYVPSIEGHPGIMEIYDPNPVTVAWHSDTTHTQAPPRMSLLLARRVPEFGGDTMFANQHAAYDGLSSGMQRLLDGLRAVHKGTERADAAGVPRSVVESVHPVVRRHPETGRPALFVNVDYTKHFEDMTERESRPLLEFLYAEGCRNEYTFRHRWRVGDLLLWDNASVQHAVVSDVPPGERSLHRVTIEGVPPV